LFFISVSQFRVYYISILTPVIKFLALLITKLWILLCWYRSIKLIWEAFSTKT